MKSFELRVGEAYKIHPQNQLFVVRIEKPETNIPSKLQTYLQEDSTFLIAQEFEGGNLLEVLMKDGIRWFYRSSVGALNFLPL